MKTLIAVGTKEFPYLLVRTFGDITAAVDSQSAVEFCLEWVSVVSKQEASLNGCEYGRFTVGLEVVSGTWVQMVNCVSSFVEDNKV